MAFVNEVIPEEQKDKFKFPVQILHNGMKPTMYKWVIDHENDFYLVKASKEGSGYDGVKEQNTFYFHAYGHDVYIKAIPWDVEPTSDNRWIFRWEIIDLTIPNQLKGKLKIIIELIVQAFKVWGARNNGPSYDEVTVEFLCDVDVQDNKEGK